VPSKLALLSSHLLLLLHGDSHIFTKQIDHSHVDRYKRFP